MPVKAAKKIEDNVWYIIAYVIPYMIGGLIVLILKGEHSQRMKLHAIQAIFLGVAMIIISAIFFWFLGFIASILNLLIWLYGLYVGFEAYNGRDIEIPTVTDYAKRYSGYKSGK